MLKAPEETTLAGWMANPKRCYVYGQDPDGTIYQTIFQNVEYNGMVH